MSRGDLCAVKELWPCPRYYKKLSLGWANTQIWVMEFTTAPAGYKHVPTQLQTHSHATVPCVATWISTNRQQAARAHPHWDQSDSPTAAAYQVCKPCANDP